MIISRDSITECIRVGVILVFALIIRLLLIRFTLGSIYTDGIGYVNAASEILQLNFTELFNSFPKIFVRFLYPFFTALYLPFTKDMELAGLLVSITFGTLLIIPVYFLAKSLYSRNVAYLSCLVVSIYPSLVEYSLYVLTESTYMFFLTTSVLFGWLSIQKVKKSIFFVTGITFALTYLVRADGFFYIFVLAFIICAFGHSKKKVMFQRLIFLFVGFAMILLPYIFLVHSYTKSFSPFGSHLNTAIAQVAEVQDLGERLKYEAFAYGLNKNKTTFIVGTDRMGLFEYVQSNSRKVLKTYGMNVYKYYKLYLPQLFPPLLIMLVGIGLFRSAWDKTRLRKEVYLASMIAYPFLIYPFFTADYRRLVTILPILIIWAAKGINDLQEWVTLHFNKSNLWNSKPFVGKILRNYIVVVIVVLSLLPMTIKYTILKNNYGFKLYKETGVWIKNHLPPDSFLMSRAHQIGFYSGMKHIALPYAEYNQIIEYAKRQNVDYIIIDEWVVTSKRPQLSFLLNESNVPKELEVVYKQDNVPGNKLIIYKLNVLDN